MRFLLIFITLVAFVDLKAQDTLFYKRNGGLLREGDEPHLFSLVSQHKVNKEGQIRIPKYYLSGQTHSVGYYKDGESFQPVGVFTYFHKNGKIESQGRYNEKGKRIGKWQRWYPNGQLNEEVKFSIGSDKKRTREVLNYYDSLGEHKVIDGNGWYQTLSRDWRVKSEGQVSNGLKQGNWTGYWESGELYFEEEYEQGALVRGVSYDKDGNSYNYTSLERAAEPKKGGYQRFYEQIAKIMRYPNEARRTGTQGKVYVEFVVNKEGELTEVKSIKGIGAGCDKEAVRSVSKTRPWTPAVQRGQRVKQRIVLPITFKLG